MEGADFGFGAFEEADFFIEEQIAFALGVERDTRGLGMRPCPVFHGIDQSPPYTPSLFVGTDFEFSLVIPIYPRGTVFLKNPHNFLVSLGVRPH